MPAPPQSGTAPQSLSVTIVYDGMCHLCSSSTSWIARRVGDRVHFVPVQSGEGSEALRVAGINALDPESFLVVRDGQPLQKTAAVIAVLNVVGSGWKTAARLLRLLPQPIADKVYDWVATNRYKWFGRRETCFVPSRRHS